MEKDTRSVSEQFRIRHYSKLNDEPVSLLLKLQRILLGQTPGSEITTVITSKFSLISSPLYTLALEARAMSVFLHGQSGHRIARSSPSTIESRAELSYNMRVL